MFCKPARILAHGGYCCMSQPMGGGGVEGTFRHFDGPGNLTISYSTEDGHTYGSSGPNVTGDEKGEVTVSIKGSYAIFDTDFEESQK